MLIQDVGVTVRVSVQTKGWCPSANLNSNSLIPERILFFSAAFAQLGFINGAEAKRSGSSRSLHVSAAGSIPSLAC